MSINVYGAAIKYGIITGIGTIGINWLSYGIPTQSGGIPSFLNNVLLLTGLIFAFRESSDSDNEKDAGLTMKQSFQIAWQFALVSGIFVSGYLWVFLYAVDSSFLQEIHKQVLSQLQTSNLSPEEKKQAEGMLQNWINPFFVAIVTFLSHALFTILYGLLVGRFFRKNKTTHA